MKPVLEQSREIKNQADTIIHDQGLDALLSEYGEVAYTGSYALDLMMKKDIDVSLINPALTLRQFFELGYRVAELVKPHSMFHRNTKVKPVDGRPDQAYYWRFHFDEWSLDIWLVSKDYHQASVEYLSSIRNALTPERVRVILALKHESLEKDLYGVHFGSKQLYPAVLSGSVRTFDELRSYLTTQHAITI